MLTISVSMLTLAIQHRTKSAAEADGDQSTGQTVQNSVVIHPVSVVEISWVGHTGPEGKIKTVQQLVVSRDTGARSVTQQASEVMGAVTGPGAASNPWYHPAGQRLRSELSRILFIITKSFCFAKQTFLFWVFFFNRKAGFSVGDRD